MKHTFLVITLLFFAAQTYSQIDDLEMYYPENPMFKRLKVKSVLDTIASPEFHHYKKEFDTLGRQISWYYIEDSVVTRFKYKKFDDTLIKFHYYTEKEIEHEVYQYEIYIYNKLGDILTYQSCRRNHGTGGKTSECSMDKFFYDDNGRLTSKLIYTNRNYKHPFSENLKLTDSLLNLVNVYSYQYDKNSKLILIKQMMGKPQYRRIDSFYYDKAGRLMKNVSRQNRGYLGEFAVNNLYRTITFKYENYKLIETTGTEDPEWEEVNEYVFYRNGLKWMWYYKAGSYPKSRLNYLVYEFYK